MLKDILILTLAILILPSRAKDQAATYSLMSGSAIVAFKNRTEIIVAADSKRSLLVGEGGKDVPVVCKIRRVDDVWFTFAGFSNDTEGFDLSEIAEQACRSPGDIPAKSREFERIIKEPFEAVMEKAKIHHPEYFARAFEDKVAADIIFFGFEAGVTVLIKLRLIAKSDPKGKVSVSVRRHLPVDGTLSFLGAEDTMMQYMVKNKEKLGRDYAIIAAKLVSVAVDAHPEHIGPPIDVVRIDKAGARWIQKKPGC